MPLPEDIQKKKAAGDLAGVFRAIQARLANHPSAVLRDRLELEAERLRRLPALYPWDRETALRKTRELIPGMTEDRFDALEDAGRVNFIWLNGEKRYFNRMHKTLALFPDLTGKPAEPVNPWLDPVISAIREKGSLRQRITLEASITLEPDAFVPGDYTVHLPYPIPCAQQRNITLLAGDPDLITDESAEARTAVWHRHLDKPETFAIRYSYESAIRYADPLHQPAPDAPLYPDELPPTEKDLSEDGGWIRFSAWARDLCREIIGDETDPAKKAWLIYDYVTSHVNYSFMPDYFLLDDPAAHCALNGTGDCGLQALMFITLCRVAGVPARWQSSLCVEEEEAGSHDWAQFWLDGWGWLFADPSFGGSAFRNGNESRRAFYFGNLDPMRMVACRRFGAPFSVPLGTVRADPTDNQSGEIARAGAEFPFAERDLDNNTRTISVETLD